MEKLKQSFTISFLLLLYSISMYGQDLTNQKTWVYTYLKAADGQKENLRTFVNQNWFAMDSIAKSQNLFSDYGLLENISELDSLEWDYIVAVEYFTKGNYEDIAEKFELIRKSHRPVLVNNLGFKDLGKIVGSETIQKKEVTKTIDKCTGPQFEILKPFLGTWEEYIIDGAEEKYLGILDIQLDKAGCNLSKRFLLYNNIFSYVTHGYYDLAEDAWIETFTFNSGGYSKYKWLRDGNDVVMEKLYSSYPSDFLGRNRWTNVSYEHFDILEERSIDAGKTWMVNSVTRIKRKI